MNQQSAEARPASHQFYQIRVRRPLVDRAEGIYLWDRSGKRFLDGASGAMVVNIGHGNRTVLDAMKRQMERVTFAYPIHFENEPAEEFSRRLADLMPGDLRWIYFVSGGSEAVEACLKMARQWAVATGQPERRKIIARMPSYHGITFGSLSVTGDGVLTDAFAPGIGMMPTIPAPMAHRDTDGLSLAERGLRYADMLEEKLREEGPETVCAFIMEPIGGAATGALVPPDSYFPRIRAICDRYGILLIHDEVMTGAGRTGRYLAGEYWQCRPDIIALSKGIGSGYMPLGAMAVSDRVLQPVLAVGGFLHGHTYGGNPVACAAGLAVLDEMQRLGVVANAAAMGPVLLDGLRALSSRYPFIGDVRGRGLLTGADLYADRERRMPLPDDWKANIRLLDHAYERGLILYSRRVRGGPRAENFMVAPPLIVTKEQVGEIISILDDSLAALARDLGLPVHGAG